MFWVEKAIRSTQTWLIRSTPTCQADQHVPCWLIPTFQQQRPFTLIDLSRGALPQYSFIERGTVTIFIYKTFDLQNTSNTVHTVDPALFYICTSHPSWWNGRSIRAWSRRPCPQAPQAQRGIACKHSQLPCDLLNHLLSGQNIWTNVTINSGCN